MLRNYWDLTTSRRRATRRQVLAAGASLGGGAVALSLVACGGGGGGSAEKSKVDPNAILTAWQREDETKDAVVGGLFKSYKTVDITGGYDPYTTPSRSTTLDLTEMIYETPLASETGPGIDPNKPLKITGLLAESYEVSGDVLTFTFRMRPNVNFHNLPPINGRVMDIDDWRVSLKRSVESVYKPTALDLFDLAQATFPDSRTMVLKAKFPYAPGPGLFTSGTQTFYVMPKEAADGRMDAATQIVGTAYRYLSSYQPSIGFEFKKHDKFWRAGKPYIDRWSLPVIPEYANRTAQFITGNIHVFTPNQADVLQMRKDATGAVLQRADLAGGLTVSYFGFKDLETAPWKDERVRQAISMVIDRKARFEYFANATDFATAGIPKEMRYNTQFSGGSYFWLDAQDNKLGDISKVFQFNVAEAKKLMTAAGFPDAIDIDTHAHTGSNYGAQYFESAQIFNDMLNKSQLFRVRFNTPTYAEWLPTIFQQRDYRGLALVHPGFGGNKDNDISLYNSYHTGSGSNFRGIKDTQLESLIDQQRRELDVEKRKNLMYDIQKYLAKTMYLIPTEGVADSFYFRWPWVRNYGWPGWNQWLAGDYPKRNG